jgi:hypothetical protein
MRELIKSCKGQNLIEFALLAPFMVIILAGIIDFGMSLDHRITVQHAVREGARYAAVQSDCGLIQERVWERAGKIFDNCDDGSCVSVSYEHNPAAAGDSVRVTAPFDWSFPLVGGSFHIGSLTIGGPGPIHAHVAASARLEMSVPNAGGCP